MSTPPYQVAEMTQMLAADMAKASGPLQTEGQTPNPTTVTPATEQSTGAPAETPASTSPETVPAQTTTETEQQAIEQAVEGAEAQEEEDDFSLDLDKQQEEQKETTQQQAAKPEGQEQQTSEDPDREIGALLATSRGKRIYASFKKDQALSAPPEPDGSGGIGHAPAVDQVKDYYRAYIDQERMKADFLSGEPDAVDRWGQHWFGRTEDGRQQPGVLETARFLPYLLSDHNPQALAELAQHVPAAIQKSNPALYQQMSSQAALEKANHLYEIAKTMQSDEDKNRVADAARVLEWSITGKWREAPLGQQATGAVSPQQDPEVQQLRSRIAELENQNRQVSQATVQRQRQEFVGEITRQLSQALSQDTDAALAKIRDVYKDDPQKLLVFNALKQQFMNEVRQAATKDAEAMQLLQTRINSAMRAGNRQAIKDIVKQWRQNYSNVLISKRPDYLKAAGLNLKAKSDQQAAQLQQASTKVEPNGMAKPVSQGGADQKLEKLPEETHQQYMQRMLARDMASPFR